MYDEVRLSPSVWSQADDVALHVRRQARRAVRQHVPCFVTVWLDDERNFTIAGFDATGAPTADPVAKWAPRIETSPESTNCTMTSVSLDSGYDIRVMVLNRVQNAV